MQLATTMTYTLTEVKHEQIIILQAIKTTYKEKARLTLRASGSFDVERTFVASSLVRLDNFFHAR